MLVVLAHMFRRQQLPNQLHYTCARSWVVGPGAHRGVVRGARDDRRAERACVYPSTQEKVVLAEIVVLRVAACAKAGVIAALVGQ